MRRKKGSKQGVQVSANVVNHFYVYGMQIDRSKNPSLADYKMVTKSKCNLHYVDKAQDMEETSEVFFQTDSQLQNLLALKSYYHIHKNH